jgi:integrase
LNPKTVKDIIMILKMILRFAAKSCGWDYRLMEIHYPPAKVKTALPTFSLREHKKLITYLEENPSNYNIGIALCLCTGMRIGEICALKWGDVDLKAGCVRVCKTIQRVYLPSKRYSELVEDAPKTTNSYREIPLSRQVVLALRPVKRDAKASWYVLSHSPKPPEPSIFRNHFYRICKKLGLPHIPFHGLRHTFATRCIESKCDYKTVSALLGHASINTTLNFYVHPDLSLKKKAVEQMTRRLK